MIDEELGKFKEEFVQISKSISENNRLSQKSKKDWQKQQEKIERRFDLFKTDLLFIVATGMLKAGKSTFVNLLSRNENASPIGFGVDTTLRPALIKMAGKDSGSHGGIYIYKRKTIHNPENEMQELQKQMENIIDRIKGLKKFDENYPEVSPKELSQDNLRKVLCSKPGTNELLDQSPLLVVVEVPYNEESRIFSENCVIFDMPGLDSNDAEISQNFEMYNAIFKECDLVLFIQSNMSPVNDAACGYLAKIGKDRSSCTYRLVQNRMRAKYWLEESIIRKELGEQAENGIKNFVKKLNTNKVSESSLKSWSANLGMAYDVIFNANDISKDKFNADELLSESEFLGMEENLWSDIKENGKEQRKSHCKDELCNDLKDVSSDMERKIYSLKSEIANKESEINILIDEKNLIESYGRRTKKENWIGLDFTLSTDLKRQIEAELRESFKHLRSSTKYCEILPEKVSSFKIKGTDYDKFLIECSENAKTLTKKIIEESNLEKVDSGDFDVIKILNKKIEEMNQDAPEIILQIPKIEYRSKTVGNLSENIPLDIAQIDPHKETGRFLFISFEKAIFVNESMLSDEYDKIIAHYVKSSCSVLKKVMGDIMTDILNAHISGYLKESLAEKESEMYKAKLELENLNGEKELFSSEKEKLLALEEKIRELKI